MLKLFNVQSKQGEYVKDLFLFILSLFFACTLLKCLHDDGYIKKGNCAFFALCELTSAISQAKRNDLPYDVHLC